MPSRPIIVALLFAAALSGQSATLNLQDSGQASESGLQVTAIRFWSLDGVTRVAIETNGDFRYKSDRVLNPDRIFFDLIGARPHLGKRITTKQVGDKLLKRVRVAETLPGVTRVVLDLESSVEFTASQLGNPDRLMIELRPGPSRITPPPPVDNPVTTTVAPALPHREPPAVFVPPPVQPPATEVAATKPMDPPPALPPALKVNAANPAKLSLGGNRSLTRALGLKINRVVVDPGHGGHDQGTSGTHGVLEKDLVLDVALRLGKLIEQRMGSEVIFTRADDTFIPLEQRTAIANDRKADLFLSIHANSSPVSKVAGIETYYLNFTSSSEALDVAARENASSQKSVFELRDLVQSIARHDKVEESRDFATAVQSSLQAFEARYQPQAKDRGIRKAPFVVLIGAQMPSILAEIGFLSNTREENLLSRSDHRQKVAEALFKGLSKYADTLSHFELSRRSEHTPEMSRPEDQTK